MPEIDGFEIRPARDGGFYVSTKHAIVGREIIVFAGELSQVLDFVRLRLTANAAPPCQGAPARPQYSQYYTE